MMKLLVTYGKEGRMRFASHRDFARCFERALRRAEIPMAYSSGFSPHPRISYINPAPTGAESDAEYVVIGLSELCDPGLVRKNLAAAMPDGFPVVDVREAGDQNFEASVWEVTVASADPSTMAGAVRAYEMASQAVVSRMTKNGLRTFDTKAAVKSLAVSGAQALTMVIRHTEPLVRPDDVVNALRALGLDAGQIPPLMKRLRQGPTSDLVASVQPVSAVVN